MPKRPRPLIEYWPGYGRLPFYYSVSAIYHDEQLEAVKTDCMIRSVLISGHHA